MIHLLKMLNLFYHSAMVLDKFIAFPPQLGHGDFSAANTKVLRMFNTLAVDSEAKQSIEALRTELQKTKEKLQAVEELKSQSGIKHKQFTMNNDFFFSSPDLFPLLHFCSQPLYTFDNTVSGDTGKLVDSYISGKITQLKEQIATLEKREER
jgi:mitotic spindle assembly checkpoint protein MAD1